MNLRPDWPEYFLRIAETVSLRASCSRRQVGAVIVDEENRICSTGYNGVPTGELNCDMGGCPRGLLSYKECPPYGSYSNCVGRHAEHNAIRTAHSRGIDLTGSTLYCTDTPCDGCTRLIKGVGIVRVICS